MIVYIGIDPGTKCGWAALDEKGDRLASGVWDLKSKRHEGAGMRYVRLSRYLRDLLKLYDDSQIQLVYEEVRHHAGTSAAHVYGGITAEITRVCELLEVSYIGIPVGTVKKHATGKGNANKAMMIEAAMAKWFFHSGLAVEDDNEADALWIADSWRVGLA